MLILRQSTAIDIRMGPFSDATDGVTPETGITLGASDQAEVLKENGAATAAMAGTFAAVTGCDGWYDYNASTTDTNTVGEVVFVVQDASVCLPVLVRAMVIEEAVYDAIYGAGATGIASGIALASALATVDTNVDSILVDTAEIGTAGAGLTNIGTIATVTDLTNLPTIPANWITAAGIAASAMDGKGDWNIGKTGYTLSTQDWNTVVPDAAGVAPTSLEIADSVWDELQSGHVTAGTFGKFLDVEVSSVSGGGSGKIGNSPQTFTLAKDATSQIIQFSAYDASDLVGDKLAGLVFNTASLTAHYNRSGAAGSATAITLVTATKGTWTSSGFIAVDATNQAGEYELHIPDAALATGVDRVTVVIQGATNLKPITINIDLVAEINLDASGNVILETATQASIDAIEVDTAVIGAAGAGLTALATQASVNTIDTNVDAILVDTAVIGAAGAGLTALATQTSVNTIDTNVDAILVDTATTIPAQITGLNDLSAAEVNTEVDTALTDYDGPTNAEMIARTPTAAQLAYMTANASTGLPVTFTTSGGSTTAAVLSLVDGGSPNATNDQYNGRLLVFTDGTLKGVVTDITDYVGSTTTATITAIPVAPTSSHNARLI